MYRWCAPDVKIADLDHAGEKIGPRKGLGNAADQHQREVFQKKRGPDRRDEKRDARGLAQGPVRSAVQQDPHAPGNEDCERKGKIPGQAEKDDPVDGRVCSDHQQVAVGEIYEAQNAVDHRIADGNQCIEASDRNTVNKLLEENRKVIRPVFSRPANGPQRRLTFEGALRDPLTGCDRLYHRRPPYARPVGIIRTGLPDSQMLVLDALTRGGSPSVPVRMMTGKFVSMAMKDL